jgi:hypothetical protein
MIEITNRKKGPISLPVRSTRRTRSLTTVVIPGRGSGKNIYLLQDERKTEYIDRVERKKLISTRYVPNKLIKGD